MTLRSGLAGGAWADALGLELLLSAAASVVLGLAVLWLGAVATLALVEAATGWSCRIGRRITPALLRRTLLTGLGVAVGAGTALSPASANPPPQLPRPTHGTTSVASEVSARAPGVDRLPDLEGLRLPDRAMGVDSPAAGARLRTTASTTGPPGRTHRVRPGECLWSIAADRLPASADPARIDETWRALYRANRDVVGSDPHLIRPGTVLRLPAARQPTAPSTDRRDRT